MSPGPVQPVATDETPIELELWPSDVRLLRAAQAVLARVELEAGPGWAELEELEAAALDLSAEMGPFCRLCGCTEERACMDGCSWLQDDLCSSHAAARKGTP